MGLVDKAHQGVCEVIMLWMETFLFYCQIKYLLSGATVTLSFDPMTSKWVLPVELITVHAPAMFGGCRWMEFRAMVKVKVL